MRMKFVIRLQTGNSVPIGILIEELLKYGNLKNIRRCHDLRGYYYLIEFFDYDVLKFKSVNGKDFDSIGRIYIFSDQN